jgi:hypothetical protein
MGGASETSAAITRAFPCIASASNPSKAELLTGQSGGPFGRCHAFRDFFAKSVYPWSSGDYGVAVVCSLPRAIAACAMSFQAVFMATPFGSESVLLRA